MEREDPLERIEREERERKTGGDLRKAVWILTAVAAALGVALAFIWIQKSSLVKELNLEKDDLTQQIESLKNEYDSLSSEYDFINSQLDSSREEVIGLVERIKKTEATNRAKMRQYERELGTLRSIMRGYIVQIDSLNTLNHQLTVAAAAARKEAAESKRQNEKLSSQVQTLSSQVAVGSLLKARSIKAEAYNASDKVTDRSTRAVRMLVSLCLVENDIADKGPVKVFVRVTDPAGNLLLDGNGKSFTLDGQTCEASAAREIDYEGKDVDISIYVNNVPSFVKGVYAVEVFTEQGKLGETELLLR